MHLDKVGKRHFNLAGLPELQLHLQVLSIKAFIIRAISGTPRHVKLGPLLSRLGA